MKTRMGKCAPNIAKYVLKVERLEENEISNWIKIVKERIGKEISGEQKPEQNKNRFQDKIFQSFVCICSNRCWFGCDCGIEMES